MSSETRTFSQSAALYRFLGCCEKDGADSEKCMEIDFLNMTLVSSFRDTLSVECPFLFRVHGFQKHNNETTTLS